MVRADFRFVPKADSPSPSTNRQSQGAHALADLNAT
jgi:hypothetical protein